MFRSTLQSSTGWKLASRIALGGLLSVGCLWLAARDVSLEAVRAAVANANPWMFGAAVLSVVAATFVGAARWWLLFFPAHRQQPVSRLWSILLMGQALNISMPARVGEVARVQLAGRRDGGSRVEVAASIALEKVFDSVALAVMLGAISLLVVFPPELSAARTGFVLVTVLLSAAAITIALRPDESIALAGRLSFGAWLPAERVTRWAQIAMKRGVVIRRWDVASSVVLLSLLVWGLAALGNYWVLRALGIQVPPVAALVVLITLQLGTAVPSIPGKVGVFQLLCVVALKPFGVENELALTYGLLLHVAAYGPPMVMGSVLLLREAPSLRGAGRLIDDDQAKLLSPRLP